MALAKPYNPAAYVYRGASPVRGLITDTLAPGGGKRVASTPGYTPPQQPGATSFQDNHTPPPADPAGPPSSSSSQASAAYVPGEGIYAQDSAAAYDAFNAATAASEKDAQSARAQYGFNAEGSNLDPSNSTGLFQRLMRSQANTGAADQEEALSRGLGGSGLGAQVGEQHNFQNQADLADLTGGYQGQLAAALARKGDANTTLTNALLAARQNQLNFDLQNARFTPAGDGTTPGGDTTPPPAPSPHPTEQPGSYFSPKSKKTTTYRPGARAGSIYAT